MSPRLTPLVLLLLFCLPSRAAAWHQDGHMAIARFAWQQLGDREKAQITKVLKAHPQYDVYLAAECPAKVAEIEWAFARASTWPDWVRDPQAPGLDAAQRAKIKHAYNKPVWHYVNLPYIHPKDAANFDAAVIRKAILEPELDGRGEPRHVLAALKRCMKLLQADDTSLEDRAINLCWLLHLVGDVHQPLHSVGLLASKETLGPDAFAPPEGDRGGNSVLVTRQVGDPGPMALHFYWDALVFSKEPGFAAVESKVAGWLKDNNLQRDQLAELSSKAFLAWAEESQEQARKVAYQGEGDFLKVTQRPSEAKPNQKGFFPGLDAPLLPDTYAGAAERVAVRRMVLAGYRLADQLALAVKEAR